MHILQQLQIVKKALSIIRDTFNLDIESLLREVGIVILTSDKIQVGEGKIKYTFVTSTGAIFETMVHGREVVINVLDNGTDGNWYEYG